MSRTDIALEEVGPGQGIVEARPAIIRSLHRFVTRSQPAQIVPAMGRRVTLGCAPGFESHALRPALVVQPKAPRLKL
jgi:hypothetical protein